MIEVYQEEMKATVKDNPESMELATKFIWSELEETIRSRVEEVLLSVDQRIQGLHEELNVKIKETRLS
jgi:hypothetical protein